MCMQGQTARTSSSTSLMRRELPAAVHAKATETSGARTPLMRHEAPMVAAAVNRNRSKSWGSMMRREAPPQMPRSSFQESGRLMRRETPPMAPVGGLEPSGHLVRREAPPTAPVTGFGTSGHLMRHEAPHAAMPPPVPMVISSGTELPKTDVAPAKARGHALPIGLLFAGVALFGFALQAKNVASQLLQSSALEPYLGRMKNGKAVQ